MAPTLYTSALWGINHFRYFDLQPRIGIVLLTIMAAAVVIVAGERSNLRRFVRTVLLYFVIPLLLLVIFYLLRVKTHYLGDGILRAREIEKGFWLLPTEPLGQIINYLVYRLTARFFHFNTFQAMETISYLSGVLYYFALLFLVKTFTQKRKIQLLSFLLLLFSGTTLLFCGYAETYSLLPALIVLFIAFGIRALEGKSGPFWALIVFLVMVCFHFKTLFLAPCIFVLAFKLEKGKRSFLIGAIVVFLIIVAAIIYVPRWTVIPTVELRNLLVSLLPGQNPYWLLSSQHLLDVASEFLLTVAAPMILLITLVVFFRSKPEWRQIPNLFFVAAALPGALALVLLLDSKLGYAVDWDLFSSAGVVISIFVVFLFTSSIAVAISQTARISLAAVALLSFVSFAAVNADYEKAMTREIDILSLYGDLGAVGFETIGNHLNQTGKSRLAETMWLKSLQLRPHWRIFANLGQNLRDQGRLEEAEYYLNRGIDIDSTQSVLQTLLGLVYCRMKKYDLAGDHLQKAIALNPEDASFYHNLALCLADQGRFAEAEVESREAVRRNPADASFVNLLGGLLGRVGKYMEGENVLTQAMQMQPGYFLPYMNLAELYELANRRELSIQLLQTFLSAYPQNPDRERVQRKLSEIESRAKK